MQIMKRLLIFAFLSILFTQAFAAGSSVPLPKVPINLHDQASLQRGMRNFVNYCQGCHSAEYMRYSRAAKDIGILNDEGQVDEELVRMNLMFTTDKIGDTMLTAMPKELSATWFGVAPPDLTLETRVRKGPHWLYAYLNGFYKDDTRPWGVNNLYFENVGMPHVLLTLQGEQAAIKDSTGHIIGLKQVTNGMLTKEAYNQFTIDLVNFMTYMAEPAKLQRYKIGVWVVLFLSLLLVFTTLLKREFWKDVK